jgi:hypothetical protein
MPISTKTCQECGGKITGRRDKKFCSEACRVAFHNRARSASSNYVRTVTHSLLRNRRILEDLNPNGKARIHRDKLQALGFNFNYFTSMYRTRDGSEYFYCFEQGYLAVDNSFYLLVIKKEY